MRSPIAIVAAATVCCGISTVSFGQAQQNTAREPQASGQEQREMQSPEHVQKCIREAASDNQFEIQAGQFVAEKAQNPQVKQLAQKLVQDHQRAQQQLQQIGGRENATAQGQLMPVQQAKLEALRQKQGEELETSFVFDSVGDHEKDVLKAQWQAQHEKNPQLQQYAQQQIPVLEEHLRMARMAAEQFVPQARQAGERMRGNTDRPNEQNSGVNSNGATNGGTTNGGASGAGRTTGGTGR